MPTRRAPNETIYAEGHAVAFMVLLARAGGSISISAGEMSSAQGTIYRTEHPSGTVTYRLDREGA